MTRGRGDLGIGVFLLGLAAAFLAIWALNWAAVSFLLALLKGNLFAVGSIVLVVLAIAYFKCAPRAWRLAPANRVLGGERAGWTHRDELSADAIRLLGWMKREVEPAFLMIDSAPSGFSKVGGQPDLPENFNWPTSAAGPLQFLMQVAFEDLPWGRAKRSSWMPESGRLWVFCRHDTFERRDAIRLFYSSSDVVLKRPTAPDGVLSFREMHVGFHRFRAAPSEDWLGPKAQPLRAASADEQLQEEAGGYVFPQFGGVAHYVGGYPQELQPSWLPMDAELSLRNDAPWSISWSEADEVDEDAEQAASDWRMLLQIDSDHRMKWSWGDGGQLYVLIRREDAQCLDFSKTVTICQFT
jgi:hypothetical protein